MCRNETPKDFLWKHITFHHMIQEREVVEKIHKMHFPSREMEVQTTVSWVNNMIQLEESLANIEANIEDNKSYPENNIKIPEKSNTGVELESYNFGIMVDETQGPFESNFETESSLIDFEDYDGAQDSREQLASQTFEEQSKLREEQDWGSIIYRYRCPYCDTCQTYPAIYDHILTEHSIPSTSRTYPSYRKPRKQQMGVKIDRKELRDNLSVTSHYTEPCWLPCDATLPEGWKYSEPQDKEDSTSYLSPSGTFLESRDQICEYLLGLGFDIFHPSGYGSITPSSVDCDGLCEGACDNFKIRKTFFKEGDENMRRKTALITYIEEGAVDKIKDSFKTDTNRNIEEVKPLTYLPPGKKGQRPWIISIQDKTQQKSSANDLRTQRSQTSSLEASGHSSLSSRENTPTADSGSTKRKRKIGGKAVGALKKSKSSSRDNSPRPAPVDEVHYEGIYVQCCKKKCQKWRLVTEFADASLVPEYWICSMNRDKTNRVCGVGGNNFSSDRPDIDVKFSRGSLVWAKLKGFPWWPGMIDSCPDSEEFYWLDENLCRHEPSWYHVVYFEGRGTEVSRAWIRPSDIVSLTTPITQPSGSTATRPGPLKQRLKNAIELAEAAKSHPRKTRLEKFSFNALFEKKSKKGKGKIIKSYKNIEEKKSESLSPSQKETVVVRKVPVARKENNSGKRTFITGPIFSDEEDGESDSDKTEKEELTDKDDSEGDMLSQILKKYSASDQDDVERKDLNNEDDLSLTGSDEDKEEASLEETLLSEYSNHHITQTHLDIKQEKTDPLDVLPAETGATVVSSSCMTEVFIKPEELISNLNPNLDRDFSKPPLPSDVLIALAVRNLETNNQRGVTGSNIAAFLSLHFPYYNRNLEECKEMIRTAYESSEAIEKENFRIKSSLVPHLLVRIKKFVTKNNLLIRESMLLAEFLDSMLERFEVGTDCEANNYRPPYSCKMLSHLAFITLCPPTSIEQIMIFLRFLFPSLDQSKTFLEKDFEDWIKNDDKIQEYLSPGGDKMYLLQEGVYPEVLHQVRQFFSIKSNLERLKKSIFKSEFVNVLLPNLQFT